MASVWIQRTMATMHLRAVDVIRKPPSERTSNEVELIAPWLRKQTHLLTGLETETLVQIVKNCDYMKADRDEILIRQGEKGDCLYIILVGQVSVYVDPTVTTEPIDNKPKQESEPAPSLTKDATNQSESRKEQTTTSIRAERLDRSRYGKMVVRFDEGKCFGEVALVSEDSIRNATIITDTETDLLVIRKELYDSTLKEHQERDFEEKRQFARRHPLFKNWDKRLHRILEMSLVKEIYGFGAQIIKQGDPLDGLMFFLKGRARLLVEPSRHNVQYEDHFPFAVKNDIYAIEFNRPQKKRPEHPEEILRWEHIEVRRTEGYAAAERRRFHREIPLCIVEEGEILGDIETVCALPTHTVSAVCMSPAEVFTLSMKNWERLTKRVPRSVDMLKMEVEMKLNKRLKTQQGSEVFMYRHLLFKLAEEIPMPIRRTPDFGVGSKSKKLPDKDMLFQHLMTTFQENRAGLSVPHVEGSIFLKERMREKARIRNTVKENKRSSEAQRKYRKTRVKRPPSAKPRSIKHLRIALKKQEEGAELSEREYLAKEFRTLENQVMKEFYLNSMARLHDKGDESEGLKVLCNRLHKAEVQLSALPKLSLGQKEVEALSEAPLHEDLFPSLERQKTFVTELRQSVPDLMRVQVREATMDSLRLRETKSAEPPPAFSRTVTEIRETEDETKHTGEEDKLENEEGQETEPKPFIQEPKHSPSPPMTPPLNVATEAIIAKELVHLDPTLLDPASPDGKEQLIKDGDHKDPLMDSQSFKQLKHVRSLISNKVDLASEDPQYRNWETSNTSLEYLEQRVKNFKINRDPTFVRLPPLTRFEAGDDKKEQPKPGGRVIIQRRRCTADDNGKYVTNHVHTRRHVVSRVPDYTKLRHQKMLSHYVLDDIRDKWLKDQKRNRSQNGYQGTLKHLQSVSNKR